MHFGWTNPYWVIWCGETCLLVSWCVGGECDMVGNDEDQGRSRRVGAEDQGWSGTSRVLNGWMIRRSGDIVCDPHHTRGGDEKRGFSGVASKPVATGCQWFGLKTTMMVSWFGPQNQSRRFGNLGLEITTKVSWFVPQNQVGGGLSVCTSKPMRGWRRCEDTGQHLVACFIMNQVRLGFPSFAQHWHRSDDGWCTWHHCGGRVEVK
jgi:hypothetical protein